MSTAWDKLWSSSNDEHNKTNHWMTPPEIMIPLQKEFQFTLDAAANANGWHPNYLGPDHRQPDRRDSFGADWRALGEGGPVFVNPPYGRGIAKWMALAQRWGEKIPVAVLVFARTDTTWWWRHVLGRDPETGELLGTVQQLLPGVQTSGSQCASEIRWRPGRIAFVDPDTGEPRRDSNNRPTSAPAPSVLVVYRPGYSGDWPTNGVFL